MAGFGAGCSASTAPQRVRYGSRRAGLRGRGPSGQHGDAQPRKAAWQDRDEDRGRHLSDQLDICVGYWHCLCAEMSAIGTKQTLISTLNMSAFRDKADICGCAL